MSEMIFKATITFEVFVSGATKADAYDKVMNADKKKVLKHAQLKRIDVEEQPYEVLEE